MLETYVDHKGVAAVADEKRIAVRVGIDCSAFIHSSDGLQMAHCRDISATGAGVDAFRPLGVGEKVRVILDLGPESTLVVHAEVVREGAFPGRTTGLRFVGNSQTTVSQLLTAVGEKTDYRPLVRAAG